MAPIVVRYPLDPSGESTNNLVQNELHTLGNRRTRAFATHYGGFFTESIVVRDTVTNVILNKNIDYYCSELYAVPTAKYGKEICSVIVITNEAISSEVAVTYQCLGGPWSTSQQAIIQMFDKINLDDRPVRWGDIIGKPTEYNPAHHLHDSGDIYGFEYIVAELERIYQAIMMGDRASHDEIYKYIDEMVNNLQDYLDDKMDQHVQSGDHDWRYWTQDQADERYIKKGESLDSTLDGPLTIYQGPDYSWHITNFDSFSNYTVSANQGIVTLSHDKVNFRSPTNQTPINPLVITLTRDGVERQYSIKILESGIMPPGIAVNTADNVCNLLTPTINLSGFVAFPAGSDTHKSTDMQLSDNPNFTNIIWSLNNVTSGTNKLQATLPKLSINKAYYFRARFNGNTYPVGIWNTIQIHTHNQAVVPQSTSRNTTYAYSYQVPTSRITTYNTAVLVNTTRITNRITIHAEAPVKDYALYNWSHVDVREPSKGDGGFEADIQEILRRIEIYKTDERYSTWQLTTANPPSQYPADVLFNINSVVKNYYQFWGVRLISERTKADLDAEFDVTRLPSARPYNVWGHSGELPHVENKGYPYALTHPVAGKAPTRGGGGENLSQRWLFKTAINANSLRNKLIGMQNEVHLGAMLIYAWSPTGRRSERVNVSVPTQVTTYRSTSKTTNYNSTVGRNTTVSTRLSTTFPIGKFTNVQKNINLGAGLNTVMSAFTGYLRSTTRLTLRNTTWVTGSNRTTTKSTTWTTYRITATYNTANYTCYNNNF